MHHSSELTLWSLYRNPVEPTLSPTATRMSLPYSHLRINQLLDWKIRFPSGRPYDCIGLIQKNPVARLASVGRRRPKRQRVLGAKLRPLILRARKCGPALVGGPVAKFLLGGRVFLMAGALEN